MDVELTSDIASVLDFIDNADTNVAGLTNIPAALQLYQTEMAADGRAGTVKIAVLLSDGSPQDFPASNTEVWIRSLALTGSQHRWSDRKPFPSARQALTIKNQGEVIVSLYVNDNPSTITQERELAATGREAGGV